MATAVIVDLHSRKPPKLPKKDLNLGWILVYAWTSSNLLPRSSTELNHRMSPTKPLFPLKRLSNKIPLTMTLTHLQFTQIIDGMLVFLSGIMLISALYGYCATSAYVTMQGEVDKP
jgi:hypothetical protein